MTFLVLAAEMSLLLHFGVRVVYLVVRPDVPDENSQIVKAQSHVIVHVLA